jgi:glyoxylase-like metal-dependent hydrolase (beta-lactamase superfamily II)
LKIKRFIGGTLESNGYIIYRKDAGNESVSCYIIDPGYSPSRFIKFINENNLTLKGIILTHHHHDHVGGVSKIAKYFDVPVLMSFQESFMYDDKVDIYLKDGDVLDLDGEELLIKETPGHTKGSICIVSQKSQVVFTGDTIFDTDLGRTDLESGSHKDIVSSCKNVINKWHDGYTIYPGHDECATMKTVRTYNKEFLDCLEEL